MRTLAKVALGSLSEAGGQALKALAQPNGNNSSVALAQARAQGSAPDGRSANLDAGLRQHDGRGKRPALSDEAFASNRRTADALGRIKGVGDLPRFTADAINTNGGKAVHEVADLIGQVHARSPDQAQELFDKTAQGIAPENRALLERAYNDLSSPQTVEQHPRQVWDERTQGQSEPDNPWGIERRKVVYDGNDTEVAQATSTQQQPANTPPPIPADKKDWFKGSEKDWTGFYDAVGKLPDMTDTERAAYMHIFGREGGMVPDKRGSAASGIIQKTADRYLGNGDLQHVKPGMPPASLSADDRAKIYRHYMDEQFATLGKKLYPNKQLEGHQILDEIGNVKGATALADGVFGPLGPDKAVKGIQEAIRSFDPNVSVDGAFGSKSLATYKRLLADPKTQKQLLNGIADQYTLAMPSLKSRWDALR